ncbi:MAG: glycosyltransferase family 2 protein [Candidatus Omnitrophica bacterium]|nr:glycosyltransferase family 2 protein [Candidatus Omnitrophota bacterium]
MLLSVIILTKDEQDCIESCLHSVHGWADEIIVIDDESTDNTVEIAQRYADKVISRKMTIEGTHRNWSYAKAKNKWVLSLDADEEVSEALRDEISKILADTSNKAFAIPIKTYIGNHWVRYGGWYPASKVRLFDKGCFRYEDVEVHPCVFVDGNTGLLTKDIIHKGYPDIAHLLSSLNRQTSLEVEKWIRTGHKMETGRFIRRSIDRFFRSYIRKRGFKDGFIGFIVAYFASLYQIISYAKYWEKMQSLDNEHHSDSKKSC